MSVPVFPWDVLLIIIGYAGRRSAHSIMLTCKRLRDYCQTKAFWEPAVRRALFRRLMPPYRILQRQFDAIDVFSSARGAEPLTLRQRVGWMFNSVVSGVASVYMTRPNMHHCFWIWDTKSGDGIRWQCKHDQVDNFIAEYGAWTLDNLGSVPGVSKLHSSICLYPLHATALRSYIPDGNTLVRRIYEIYDPARDATWIGDSIIRYDEKRHVIILPYGDGNWHKGKLNPK